jgi:hypothetical protein
MIADHLKFLFVNYNKCRIFALHIFYVACFMSGLNNNTNNPFLNKTLILKDEDAVYFVYDRFFSLWLEK